jgi:hypothetical protein
MYGRTQLSLAGFVSGEANRREMMAQTTEIPPSENDKVVSWRLHVLIEAGYPADLAKQIASSEADLHHAVELVLAGCSFETATQIVL